jgi:hypothetical protein
MAIYAWRNALVFHSLDKMTSTAIHIIPPLTTYAIRWCSFDDKNSYVPSYPKFSNQFEGSIDIGLFMPIVNAIIVYVFWQVIYYYFIFIRRSQKVFTDNSHATSFTYMLADHMKHKKDSFLVGLFLKTKPVYQPFLFMGLNLGYAVITLLPTGLLYRNFYIHTTYIIFIVMVSIFNGADYYIEVFSKRYRSDLEEFEKNIQRATSEQEVNFDHVVETPESKSAKVADDLVGAPMEQNLKAKKEN